MEQLKVRKKGMIILNSIFYLGLSFIFIYLQYAYRSHLTPFSTLYLQRSLQLFWYIALPLIICTVFLWNHHKNCSKLFVLSTVLVGFKILEGLFIEFNKMIVVTFFFYIVISYFLYQLLNQYLTSARLNANYSKNDLFNPLLCELNCVVKDGDIEIEGILTNWDEEGCFIKLKDSAPKKLKKVELIIKFAGREFYEQGEVVAQSTSMTGLGIKLKNSFKDLKIFNWNEFIELVDEQGFDPKRLR